MDGIELSHMRLGELIDALTIGRFTGQKETAARVQSMLMVLHDENKANFKTSDELKAYLRKAIQPLDRMQAMLLPATWRPRKANRQLEARIARARAIIDDQNKPGGYGPGADYAEVPSYGELLVHPNLALVQPRFKNAIMLAQLALRLQVLLYEDPAAKYNDARMDDPTSSPELNATALAFNTVKARAAAGELKKLNLDSAAFDWPPRLDPATHEMVTGQISVSEVVEHAWHLVREELKAVGHEHIAAHLDLAGFELGMPGLFDKEPFMLNYEKPENPDDLDALSLYEAHLAFQAYTMDEATWAEHVNHAQAEFFRQMHEALMGLGETDENWRAGQAALAVDYIQHLGFTDATLAEINTAFMPQNASASKLAVDVFKAAHHKTLHIAREWDLGQRAGFAAKMHELLSGGNEAEIAREEKRLDEELDIKATRQELVEAFDPDKTARSKLARKIFDAQRRKQKKDAYDQKRMERAPDALMEPVPVIVARAARLQRAHGADNG